MCPDPNKISTEDADLIQKIFDVRRELQGIDKMSLKDHPKAMEIVELTFHATSLMQKLVEQLNK